MRKKAAIFSICFVTLLYLAPSVAMADIVSAFPEAAENAVMLILTLPSLAGIFGIVTVPFLTGRFSLRSLSLLGLVLTLLGGAVSFFSTGSFGLLAASSVLTGIAYGILSTVFPLLVHEDFSGPEEDRVMGVASGFLHLGRFVTMLLGGYLADIRWNYVYLTFGFALIALLLVLLSPKKAARPAPRRRPAFFEASLWKNRALWGLSLSGLAFTVLYYLNSTHASLYIEGYQLGTASTTGLLSAAACVIAGGISFLFSRIYHKTGKYTFALACVILCLGYLTAGVSVSLAGILAGLIGSSAAMGLFTPYLMLKNTSSASPEETPALAAIVLSFVNLGYFLSPSLTAPMGRLLGNGAPASVFLACGLASLLLAAVLFLAARRQKKH